MVHSSGGTKRSSWLTFRRRLLLVRTLLRGPATGSGLVEAINAELGEQGYPAAASAALKHDLDALKGEYGCLIRYDRSSRQYVLDDVGELALLDLPDACMEALAFLDASFPAEGELFEHAHVRALIERVQLLLPPARQAQLRRQRSGGRTAPLPPEHIPAPRYALRYTLIPQVAHRRDVTSYFPDTAIAYNADGSATVTATVSNLWQARQVLLRYGEACTVHEPPELVDLFAQTARGLGAIYSGGEA